MIRLTKPILLNKTDFTFDEKDLSVGTCGLFRMNLQEAIDTQPYYAELLRSAPIPNPQDYEVDIKVHMLMPNQYPCIPNWHCDNVPRTEGILDYTNWKEETPPMLLWLSGNPNTEFISEDIEVSSVKDHQELTSLLENTPKKKAPSNQWIAFTQHSPHRGTMSEDFTWRVFVRITHKSITPSREVLSTMRMHSQVYLDANAFGW